MRMAENKELTELLKELKILTICINEFSVQMNRRIEMDKKWEEMYYERKEYLTEQTELVNKINIIINPK